MVIRALDVAIVDGYIPAADQLDRRTREEVKRTIMECDPPA
jgi:hypothetical protein